MKWQILSKKETGGEDDTHYLDADLSGNMTVEVYLHKKMYIVNFAENDSIFINKTRKFKTLTEAKKHASRWFRNKLTIEINKLKNILNSN